MEKDKKVQKSTKKNQNRGSKTVKVTPKKKVSVSSSTKASKEIPTKKEEKVVSVEEVKTEVKEIKSTQNVSEKKANEVTRTIVVCAVLIVLIGLTFVVGLTTKKDKLLYQSHVGIKDITVSEYLDIIAKDDTSIIYIGRPGCGYCQMFNPILTEVLNKYKIGVEYVNIEEIASEEEWNSFIESNDYLSAGEWGTPTLIIYKNGEVVNINPGYVENDVLVKFLSDNELIKVD